MRLTERRLRNMIKRCLLEMGGERELEDLFADKSTIDSQISYVRPGVQKLLKIADSQGDIEIYRACKTFLEALKIEQARDDWHERGAPF